MLQQARPENHFHLLSALFGLAPTLLATGFKWLQDNSRSRRRVELTDRITSMSKTYAEQATGSDDVMSAARIALGGEIIALCCELTSLQAGERRMTRRSISGWLSDSFLLFRPYGALAWTVHLIFYMGVLFMLLGLLGVAIESGSEQTASALFGFFIIGLIMLGLQRLAMYLHRRTIPVLATTLPGAGLPQTGVVR